VSILESNQSTLAGVWRSVAGAFDGSAAVQRSCASGLPAVTRRLAGGHPGSLVTATKKRQYDASGLAGLSKRK